MASETAAIDVWRHCDLNDRIAVERPSNRSQIVTATTVFASRTVEDIFWTAIIVVSCGNLSENIAGADLARIGAADQEHVGSW